MRRLLRFNAVLIDAGVTVVAAVGGLAAGSLRRLASIGEGPPEGETPVAAPEPEPRT